MNKLVCYTCCTGGYDDILQHEVVNPEWDYVFFTDNQDLIKKKQVGHWEIRPLVYDQSTKVKQNRWHKTHPHILFPEYEYSLYVDANISIANSRVFDRIKQFIKDDVLIAIPRHPERNCIYDEAQNVVDHRIEYEQIVNEEMDILRKDGYPENNGLFENNVIFRQHNKLKNVMEDWWNMILKYSKRDQLSFNYIMWKNGVEVRPFYDNRQNHHNNGDFIFQSGKKHNQDVIRKLFQIDRRPDGSTRIYVFKRKIFSYKRRGKK